jgi:hypothetical protein
MDDLFECQEREICPGGIESLIWRDSTQTDGRLFQYHVQDNKWPISLRHLCYRFGIVNCSLDKSFLSELSMTSSLLSRERIMMRTFSASTRRSFALQNKLSFGLHQRYPYILVLIRYRQLVGSCSCRSLWWQCSNIVSILIALPARPISERGVTTALSSDLMRFMIVAFGDGSDWNKCICKIDRRRDQTLPVSIRVMQ